MSSDRSLHQTNGFPITKPDIADSPTVADYNGTQLVCNACDSRYLDNSICTIVGTTEAEAKHFQLAIYRLLFGIAICVLRCTILPIIWEAITHGKFALGKQVPVLTVLSAAAILAFPLADMLLPIKFLLMLYVPIALHNVTHVIACMATVFHQSYTGKELSHSTSLHEILYDTTGAKRTQLQVCIQLLEGATRVST